MHKITKNKGLAGKICVHYKAPALFGICKNVFRNLKYVIWLYIQAQNVYYGHERYH